MTPPIKRTIKWFLGMVLGFFILTNLWVWSAGWNRDLRNEPSKIPSNTVLVLLGIDERDEKTGQLNECFKLRIEAAAELCRTGKIKLIVASGYNHQAKLMADRLREAGVATPIVLDPYGWRTLDSVRRSAEIFPGETIIYVSQGWHCDRAVWLADRIHDRPVNALYYSAGFGHSGPAIFNFFRDFLAKPKAVLDWILGSQLSTPIKADEGYKVYP